jgi:GxxExxY protein
MKMRLRTPLAEETEVLLRTIIGCTIDVHRNLGPGFLESVYKQAMCLEMRSRSIGYECEKAVSVTCRGQEIARHRICLVVRGLVVVELKAVPALERIHVAQVVSYLRATELRAGLLFNFNAVTLKDGLRRIVL